ncbi:MAG: 3-keto-5-aminohexanoate cleavage protein [Actinomycetia bacterium]|nr:3-keto-5-aminohexanoate cleavage protein [Actinomycetes bacterium]
MNRDIIITCAITGAGDTAAKHPELPITPEQISTSALGAADAGAAIVHIHVRDPETGAGTRDVDLYRQVVEQVRAANTDVIINLTGGMGGDVMLGDPNPLDFQPGTDLVGGLERLAHVEALTPDICSLDCGSLNFGEGHALYVSTPDMLRDMAKRVRELGVKPELEVFDTGNLWFASQMVDEGLIDDPPWIQLCTGIPYGMPNDVGLLSSLINLVPANAQWTSFGISSMQIPWVAQSVLLGGHVRVGLEDNLYLERGVFASNADLVDRAAQMVTLMGGRIQGPDQARTTLGLQ